MRHLRFSRPSEIQPPRRGPSPQHNSCSPKAHNTGQNLKNCRDLKTNTGIALFFFFQRRFRLDFCQLQVSVSKPTPQNRYERNKKPKELFLVCPFQFIFFSAVCALTRLSLLRLRRSFISARTVVVKTIRVTCSSRREPQRGAHTPLAPLLRTSTPLLRFLQAVHLPRNATWFPSHP